LSESEISGEEYSLRINAQSTDSDQSTLFQLIFPITPITGPYRRQQR
jgi:hypothetical protein